MPFKGFLQPIILSHNLSPLPSFLVDSRFTDRLPAVRSVVFTPQSSFSVSPPLVCLLFSRFRSHCSSVGR
ncbi:hypothetical protein L1887_18066 [Cichorium endivia]|nr:hypothetical protein L1887_18066 [Cichorium endivia]